jgi:carboxymethylenebutenolidase
MTARDPLKDLNHLQRYLVEEYVEDYQEGAMTRRQALKYIAFGGGMTWLTAVKSPDLKAAVPYYGPNPPLEGVPNITAAVLAIYGENDQRINAGIPAIEEAMKKKNKVFEKIIYPGAAHAFHNDTGRNYHPEAAENAWKRTLEWFARYVKGS